MVSRASPAGAMGLLASSLLGLAAALGLSSCAFFGRDMFPSELQYREASFDLDAALAKLGQTYRSVAKIERLSPVGGESRLFVLLQTDAGLRLAILDDDLEGIESLRSDSSLARFMLGDVAGGYACGSLVLDAALAVSATADASLQSAYDAAGYRDEASSTNVALWMGGTTTLSVYTFQYDWTLSSFPGYPLLPVSPASGYYLADLLSIDAASPFILALLPNDGSRPLLAVQSDRAAFDASRGLGYGASGAAMVYLDFHLDDGRIWLTADGAVALRNDDKVRRLSRIDYGDGEELDYLYLGDSTEEQVFSFEPEGKFWYRFDGKSGILYKLRTWW
ncbi:MAG TPA: hypothetical protein PLB91_07560 [Spirochaetales bacterium]|nr:hypothetical protein [Spirochaetales bacterium]HRY54734.1 hypothetical protein [Spirochaetia bacterium]HRZ64989.1 hypothetical protein [Spirochaetia bacterium]